MLAVSPLTCGYLDFPPHCQRSALPFTAQFP